MFGENPVAKSELYLGGDSLTVVDGSPFYTIQGEGPYAGCPAMFLRLHGCGLRCYFCDTYFSSPEDPRLQVGRILNTMNEMWPEFQGVGPTQKLAVITGGEPTRQNLSLLIGSLLGSHWQVQIETAGLFWQDIFRYDGVDLVVSPKTQKVHKTVALYAKAFKYVIKYGETSSDDGLPVTNTQDPDGKKYKLARPLDSRIPIFLSPMDEGEESKNALNRRAVAESAMKFGYRAGLQLHKFMDLP